MKDSNDSNNNHSENETTVSGERCILGDALASLIQDRIGELTRLGFSQRMAHFDCIATIKMIIDQLYDEFDVGLARKEWYREFARVRSDNPN